MPYYYYYNDPYIWMLVVVMILASIAQMKVKGSFAKYNRVFAERGMTGASCARMLLDRYGARDVRVEVTSGRLSDHFDPRSRVIRLSGEVYNGTSVAALGIAAHECGHAVQYATGYLPIKIRGAIIPITQLGSNLSWPLMFLGILFSFYPLAAAGVILFSLCVLFQLITLPVEFNASHRALSMLSETAMLSENELKMSKKVLSAAALTYVAALAVSVVNLLRMAAIVRRGRD